MAVKLQKGVRIKLKQTVQYLTYQNFDTKSTGSRNLETSLLFTSKGLPG